MDRITFELEAVRVEEIERLMQLTGVRTKKEYFNNALALLKWAIKERCEGRQIASVDESNRSVRELRMPALETAAELAKQSVQAAAPVAAAPARR